MTTSSAEDASKVVDNNVTFTKDVAPIFYKNCTACHRPGEVAPMSLLTYKMPGRGQGHSRKGRRETDAAWQRRPQAWRVADDRRISQEAIDTIAKWVDGGAREGDQKDLPPAPEYAEGWRIGKPDQTFSIPEQAVPADGESSR